MKKKFTITMVVFVLFAFFLGCTLPTSYVHIYKKVKYTELDSYLEKLPEDRVFYIDLKGIVASDLKGNISAKSCSVLGKKLKVNNTKLVGIKLPKEIEGLVSMGACFLGCDGLVDLANIPRGVESLAFCFKGCKNLKELPPLPDTIKDMSSCFENCVRLIKGQSIPENVTKLSSCFAYCGNLESVEIKGAFLEEVSNYDYMLEMCSSLVEKSVRVRSVDLKKFKEEAVSKRIFGLNSGNSKYADQLKLAQACFYE